MGTYSPGYHALIARLEAKRPVPTVEEAWQAVRWWLVQRDDPYWSDTPHVTLGELERHLRVLLAAPDRNAF